MVGVVTAVTLAFFGPIARHSATFSTVAGHQTAIYPWRAAPSPFSDAYPQSDQADTFFPWQVMISSSLRDGDIPLWDPYTFGGHPFLGNGQNGALYPLRVVLSLLVDPSWVHDLLLASHVLIGGIAMWVLARELRLRTAGALLAAVAWMLSPFSMAWMQLEVIGPLVALLPLVLAFVRKASHHHRVRNYAIAGVLLALIAVGANAQMTLVAILVSATYALALSISDARSLRRDAPGATDREARGRSAARLLAPALPVIVGLGLSAVVILPTADLAARAGRAELPYSTMVANHGVDLADFAHAFWAPPLPVSERQLNREMTFVGTPVAALAVLAISRIRRSALGIALGATALLLSVGTPLTRLAYEVVPGFGHIRLGRLLFLWALGLALLGGIGLDRVVARLQRRRHDEAPSRDRLLLRSIRIRTGLAAAVAAACIAATAWQLGAYGRRVNPPFQPRESQFLYPTTPAIVALHADARRPGEQRLLPIRRALGEGDSAPTMYASQSMVFALQSGAGYESALPDRTVALWRVVAGDDVRVALRDDLQGAFIPSFFTDRTRWDLLARTGITTLLTPPEIESDPHWDAALVAGLGYRRTYTGVDGAVFSQQDAAPRAWLVHRSETTLGPNESLRRFASPTFDFRRTVLLERNDPGPRISPWGERAPSDAAVVVERYEAGRVVLFARAEHPGWVVIADMWDPGWRATVNGQGAPVLRANFNQRAVRVDRGTSLIELTYAPRPYTVGKTISILTAVGLGVAPFATLLARRLRARSASRERPTPADK